MTDVHRALVDQASRGEGLALDALLERHLPALLAFVRLHAGAELRQREASMDLVQSACREVLADLGQMRYRDEANFKHWLFLAAERKLADRARFHGRERRDVRRELALDPQTSAHEARMLGEGLGTLYTPSQDAIARETLDRALAAFGELSGEYRQVIVLARIVGLSHGDIAREMGRSETAVRTLLHRALARLARSMGPTQE